MPGEDTPVWPTVLITRHGETAWNVEGRMQGHRDISLTDVGVAQAHALAERLRLSPPARIVSSDLSRALGTARIVGEACGVAVTVDPRLREQQLGSWEGQSFAEVWKVDSDVAERFRAYDPDARPSGGETRRELSDRAWSAFESHAGPASAGPVLFVSHGGTIQTLVYRVLGLPLSTPRRFLLPNAGLTTVTRRGDAWFIRTLNDTSHLDVTSGDRFPFE